MTLQEFELWSRIIMGAGVGVITAIFCLGYFVSALKKDIEGLTAKMGKKANQEMTDMRFNNTEQRITDLHEDQTSLALSVETGFSRISTQMDELSKITHRIYGQLNK